MLNLLTHVKNKKEELAEKIGVSRQAVSKWERGEAFPNTESLIMLAKLYGLSIDELLDITPSENQTKINLEKSPDYNNDEIKIVMDGKDIRDEPVPDNIGLFDETPAFQYNAPSALSPKLDNLLKTCDRFFLTPTFKFINASYPLLMTFSYLFFGYVFNLWEYAWLLFLTIPLFYTTVPAIKKRNLNIFCYPMLVVTAYLTIGMLLDIWAFTTLLFLTIPIYYIAVNTFLRQKKNK